MFLYCNEGIIANMSSMYRVYSSGACIMELIAVVSMECRNMLDMVTAQGVPHFCKNKRQVTFPVPNLPLPKSSKYSKSSTLMDVQADRGFLYEAYEDSYITNIATFAS